MVPRARQLEIETLIVEMLEDYNLARYPISIRQVAEALKIDLIPYSELPPDENQLAVSASEDAFSVYKSDFSVAKIAVNDTNGSYFNRSRFSGGHEVGHVHMAHKKDTLNREREADYYSGYLLAPHPLILHYCKGATPHQVANVFGISEDSARVAIGQAKYRLKEGGPWKPHEKWLIEHIEWKGGGLFGRT